MEPKITWKKIGEKRYHSIKRGWHKVNIYELCVKDEKGREQKMIIDEAIDLHYYSPEEVVPVYEVVLFDIYGKAYTPTFFYRTYQEAKKAADKFCRTTHIVGESADVYLYFTLPDYYEEPYFQFFFLVYRCLST